MTDGPGGPGHSPDGGSDTSETGQETSNPSISKSKSDPQLSWTKIGSIAGAISAVVAVILLLQSCSGDPDSARPVDQRSTEGQSSVVSTPVSPANDTTGAASAATVRATGTCLSSADDLESNVACDTGHLAEIIGSADECSMEHAIRYMGGDPGVEVLHRDVQISVLEDACVLQHAGQQAEVSFHGALELDSGTSLRECYDRRGQQFVSCSKQHNGEVVARLDSGTEEELDCDAKATEYMGQAPQKRYDELTVDEVRTDAARRCVVALRSENRWLETSLRSLGSAAIAQRAM